MKTIFYTILTICLSLGSSECFGQQVPYRSQFGATDFYFNPAMTAPGEYLEWGAHYRQQWLGFEGAPNTASAYFQYPFVYSNMSLGLGFLHDNAGPLQQNGLSLTYSYKFQLGLLPSDQLSLGILVGLNQQRFDSGLANVSDQDDLLLSSSDGSTLFSDFGFGFLYVSDLGIYNNSNNGFFLGAGSNQLVSPQLSDGENGLEREVHGNAVLGARFVNEFSFIEPSIWLNYSYENLFNVTGNVSFEMNDAFWTGLSYASDHTVGFQAGLIFKNGLLQKGFLRLGGQGVYNVGRLSEQKGFGFEFLLAYRYWI